MFLVVFLNFIWTCMKRLSSVDLLSLEYGSLVLVILAFGRQYSEPRVPLGIHLGSTYWWTFSLLQEWRCNRFALREAIVLFFFVLSLKSQSQKAILDSQWCNTLLYLFSFQLSPLTILLDNHIVAFVYHFYCLVW